MRAKLEFKLPDDQYQFDLCRKAGELQDELNWIHTQVRSWRKHGHKFKDADEALDTIWDSMDHSLLDH